MHHVHTKLKTMDKMLSDRRVDKGNKGKVHF